MQKEENEKVRSRVKIHSFNIQFPDICRKDYLSEIQIKNLIDSDDETSELSLIVMTPLDKQPHTSIGLNLKVGLAFLRLLPSKKVLCGNIHIS